MVGTVEQEFRAAGNGAELSDYQLFVVDRVMIKYTVPLEKQRGGTRKVTKIFLFIRVRITKQRSLCKICRNLSPTA